MTRQCRADRRSWTRAFALVPVILGATLVLLLARGQGSTLQRSAPLLSIYEASEPQELVKPSPVVAELSRDTAVFTDSSLRKIGERLQKGQKVVVLRDHRCLAYEVSYGVGSGWVPADALLIPDHPPTNPHRMTTEEIEAYVDSAGLSSDTGFLIWVDIDRQLLHVLTLEDERWRLDRTMVCSTGRNVSPTIRGKFTIDGRGEWFFSEVYKSGARNWVRFSGPYMIHSVTMDRYGRIKDPVLGERRTAGCIRVSLEDSRWIYESIPDDTLVYVH